MERERIDRDRDILDKNTISLVLGLKMTMTVVRAVIMTMKLAHKMMLAHKLKVRMR